VFLHALHFPRNESANPAEYLGEQPEMSFSPRGIKEGQNKKKENKTMKRPNIVRLTIALASLVAPAVAVRRRRVIRFSSKIPKLPA
jgi:hypothetical protein